MRAFVREDAEVAPTPSSGLPAKPRIGVGAMSAAQVGTTPFRGLPGGGGVCAYWGCGHGDGRGAEVPGRRGGVPRRRRSTGDGEGGAARGVRTRGARGGEEAAGGARARGEDSEEPEADGVLGGD